MIDAILAVTPIADFSDPAWGLVDLPGASIEVNVGDDEPLSSFSFHVRASDRAAADEFLRAVLDRLGARAFDSETDGEIFA